MIQGLSRKRGIARGSKITKERQRWNGERGIKGGCGLPSFEAGTIVELIC